jgi:gluconolactonase
VRNTVCLLVALTACESFAAEPQSIIDETSPLETIATDFGLADGPAWNGRALTFPDVKGGKLFRYFPKPKKVVTAHGDIGRISASFFNRGTLFLSDNGNGVISRLDGQKKVELTKPMGEGKDLQKPNDLVVDQRGGIYFTLTRENKVMYRKPDGGMMVAVDGVVSPNGITLSPDEKTLYVAAYRPKEIWQYTLDVPRRSDEGMKFATMDDGKALGADGMTIDRAGNVYCAGATDIWIWNPSGKLLGKIACPTRPINCTFGDSDMRSLYITGFGGLYRQRMNTYGLPAEPPHFKLSGVASETRPSTAIPENVDLHANIVYSKVGDRKLLLDIAIPKDGKKLRPTILVVHGGGWLNGYKDKFRAITLALAKRGYVTAVIEYRLGYEEKFPAGIHDCFAAVDFLVRNADRYGIDRSRIGAVGGSAGGHLVGLMATGWADPKLHGGSDAFVVKPGSTGSANAGFEHTRLKAAIVMAGPMEMISGSVAQKSRAGTANSNVWLGKTITQAPQLYATADAHVHISKDSSPILFMVGEHDNPSRNLPSRNKLKEAGVWTGLKVYKDGKHGCWNQLPWFNDMAADMDEFFREQLK